LLISKGRVDMLLPLASGITAYLICKGVSISRASGEVNVEVDVEPVILAFVLLFLAIYF
jgi:hypothetical protein